MFQVEPDKYHVSSRSGWPLGKYPKIRPEILTWEAEGINWIYLHLFFLNQIMKLKSFFQVWKQKMLNPILFYIVVAQSVKNLPAVWVRSLGWEDPPGGGHSNPFQYSCLENPYGQRSLAGCSPWGHRLDMTEQLNTHGRLLREITITSDMQMTPPLWQKAKRN